ncbi:MAG: hypothetical protein UT36_C0003G0103 [Candidatus Peregrinibacteria bacterium GW2011_GWF2_39_17]|nr:MAG: hypothetical protein UT36_C0003G0103 [Candidatus Peregrinibacteria bacterium GW2011_GWF2_39_17]HCW31935.1 hypothetical protein [Candidatus Peregrinibacteria bacterium]
MEGAAAINQPLDGLKALEEEDLTAEDLVTILRGGKDQADYVRLVRLGIICKEGQLPVPTLADYMRSGRPTLEALLRKLEK